MSSPGPSFLAVDWGTTNRRVFLIRNGAMIRSERDDRGVTAIPPGGFEAEAAGIRARFGDLPMLLAGMVGANIGWRQAPYVEAPADLAALVSGLLWVDARTAIVPGVSTLHEGRGDVMRGEEVQLLGAAAAALVPARALLSQPGTHCKWAELEDGRITGFVTAMTGELFAMLRSHGLLAPQLGAPVSDGPAFRAGVEEGRGRDLAASLFGIRAAGLLGLRADADAASFASGLLIGADVAARLQSRPPGEVHILAGAELGALYAAAVAANGHRPHLVDSHAAFAAGAIALGALLGDFAR